MRHLPLGRRAAAVVVAAAALAVAGALPASAHVTAHADDTTAGASDVALTFRVPNEEGNAATTELEVQLPTASPLLGVLVAPHEGWKDTVTNRTLNPPAKTDDGEITEVVSVVTWTADSPEQGIPVGGYEDFDLDVGQLPDAAGDLTFKAVQTYSDGSVVRWIDVPVAGQADPEHPAPTLTLTASDSATAASGTAPATTASAGSHTDGLARVLGIVGIVLALAAGAGGFVLGRRKRPAA